MSTPTMITRAAVPAAALLLAGLTTACQKAPPKVLASQAASQATLATDSAQARLWRAASTRVATMAAVVQPVETPVSQRHRIVAPSRPVPGAQASFSREMRGGLRVMGMSELPPAGYAGPGTVATLAGELVGISFGGEGKLSLLARARGGPLRLKVGEAVELELRSREDPTNRRRIVALRTQARDGLVSILETGAEPVTVTVKLWSLTARQVGRPDGNTMPVEVSVLGERRTLRQGELVDFTQAGVTVGLLGSTALTGADRFRAEGNPFAIDLIAWPTK